MNPLTNSARKRLNNTKNDDISNAQISEQKLMRLEQLKAPYKK